MVLTLVPGIHNRILPPLSLTMPIPVYSLDTIYGVLIVYYSDLAPDLFTNDFFEPDSSMF